MKTLHHSLVLLLSCGLWGLQAPAWAHGEQPNQVKILQERLPSNAPGKSRHAHRQLCTGTGLAGPSAPWRGYGLCTRGAVASKLNDERERIYKAGEYWYEAPGTVHSVSRNASQSRPAKLLVWSLVDEGKPVTEPLK